MTGRPARRRARAVCASALVIGTLSAGVVTMEGTAGAVTNVKLYVTATGSGTVCTSSTPCGSIQTAVTRAETAYGATTAVTITVGPGTYAEHKITITAPTLASLTIVGKTGATTTTVDAHRTGSVFLVSAGVIAINGLSITGGVANTCLGGGVASYPGSTISLEDDVFSTDTAECGGGGVSIGFTSNASLVDDNFSNDAAATSGGGLYSTRASVTLTGVSFVNDTAYEGGGIFNAYGCNFCAGTRSSQSGNSGRSHGTLKPPLGLPGSLTMTGGSISASTATVGGGVYNATGSVTLTDVTVSTDTATRTGGGAYNSAGSLTLTGDTFTNDSAPYEGGAVANDSPYTFGTLKVTDTTFATDSVTSTEGGAIDNTGVATFTNVTFANDFVTNTSTGGGAIENDGTLTARFVTFSNDTGTPGGAIFTDTGAPNTTVIASIFDGSSCVSGTGTPISGAFDVVTATSTGCTVFATSVTSVSATALTLTTTLRANTTTGRYSTAPETLSIGRTSPAINEVPSGICRTVTTDERGAPRPGDRPATQHTTSCDAGAYELQFTSSTTLLTTIIPGGATLPPATQVYGTTADATSGAEFTRAFPYQKKACPTSRVAVVATTSTFQDALSSQYLAQHFTTGTLLTPTTVLAPATEAALKDEGISTVYVVGGTLAITATVAAAIAKLPAYQCGGVSPSGTLTVHRLSGATQYGTAEAIAEFVGTGASVSFPGAYAGTNATGGTGSYNDTAGTGSGAPSGSLPTAILADGTEFQDAQAASVISYRTKLPLLLTPATTLSTTAVAAIQKLGIRQVILMGGPLAVTNAVEQALVARTGVTVVRVAGKSYTETATQLADFEAAGSSSGLGWTPGHRIMVTRGNGYTDGIAGAVLDNPHNTATGPPGTSRPLLLTESPTAVGTPLATFLKLAGRTGIDRTHAKTIGALTILGGGLAVSRPVITAMQQDLSV
ncbi:MAG TPA: cell wall-binding repeat-containing protein [Acidimicrobiales bacterium]|nr:cell wall-binding repeat-containing protein [Acidimicrobiales bacterium]